MSVIDQDEEFLRKRGFCGFIRRKGDRLWAMMEDPVYGTIEYENGYFTYQPVPGGSIWLAHRGDTIEDSYENLKGLVEWVMKGCQRNRDGSWKV